MEIRRDKYLDLLIHGCGNGLIKVITGMRRCGKSYLLFTLFKNYLIKQGVKEDHIIGVNLENRLNKSLRDPDALLQYIAVFHQTVNIMLCWMKYRWSASLRMY